MARVAPVRGAVFVSRGTVVMAGTNVRVSDVVSVFTMGDSIAQMAETWGVEPATIEAALRTALRAGRPDP